MNFPLIEDEWIHPNYLKIEILSRDFQKKSDTSSLVKNENF